MAPDKSSFAQTFNLLRKYLRERGASLGDISLTGHEQSRTPPTTMDLLHTVETSRTEIQKQDMNVTNLLPQLVGSGSTNENSKFDQEDKNNKSDEMTIFYAGKVLVFDDFPADKAFEIMDLASKGGAVDAFNDGSSNITILKESTTLASVSDLPIVRKASLRRFFDKRKERFDARAPYQLKKPSTSTFMDRLFVEAT